MLEGIDGLCKWFGVWIIIVLFGFFGVGKLILVNMFVDKELMIIFVVCFDGKGCYIIMYW